jgi:hypothetical protein
MEHPQPALPPHLLRLADAGDAKPAWITLLTTEHYTLGMQRAATISEVNGRASIFIGAVSAGLIALGFEGAGSRHSAGSTVFAALVLTPCCSWAWSLSGGACRLRSMTGSSASAS